MKTCPKCGSDHSKPGTFCGRKCANGRVQSEASKKKTSEAMKGRALSEDRKQRMRDSWHKSRGLAQNDNVIRREAPQPKTIADISSRTAAKIMARLGIGCSRCGWSETSCDIHHIRGRKIEDPHHHSNLCYLCPNCHRLVHNKQVAAESLISFETQVGERWREYYYG